MSALEIEWADDHRAFCREYAARESYRLYGERLVRSLILSTGGPWQQRKPGRSEYDTRQSLMHFAQRYREGWKGFRAGMVQARIKTLGFDMALIESAARGDA